MVLFLFVIMLLNLRGGEGLGAPPPALSQLTKYVFGVLLTLELAFIVKAAPLAQTTTGILEAPVDDFGSVKSVAERMFTDYLYPFELTGVLMLAAVVGAVVIAKKRRLLDSGDAQTDSTSGETKE